MVGTPPKPFSVSAMHTQLVSVKKINVKHVTVSRGLSIGLETLRRTNLAILHLEDLAKQEFRADDEPLLERLWNQLMPNLEFEGEIRQSSSWGNIGFQGTDPASDFSWCRDSLPPQSCLLHCCRPKAFKRHFTRVWRCDGWRVPL